MGGAFTRWDGQSRYFNIFALLFFLSGASSLVYEVAWTRLFIPVIGNTALSVSAILCVFMTGLALGSKLAGCYVDRQAVSLPLLYAQIEAALGTYNIFNIFLPSYLGGPTPISKFAIMFLMLIVPATLIGATLPILVRLHVHHIEDTAA